MRVLIAEDSLEAAASLAGPLRSWGYDVVTGEPADHHLCARDICVVLLDWTACSVHPDPYGRIRELCAVGSVHIILLASPADGGLLGALHAGAHDFVATPVNEADLRARLLLAARRLGREARRGRELQEPETAAIGRRTLRGRLPICAYCKSIRDERSQWRGIEAYIAEHAHVQFSHGVCPGCVGIARAAMDAVLKS